MPTLKTAIATKDAPAAIGPYSQAIRVGDMLYASGQVALDPATGQLVAGGIAEQTTSRLRKHQGRAYRSGPRYDPRHQNHCLPEEYVRLRCHE